MLLLVPVPKVSAATATTTYANITRIQGAAQGIGESSSITVTLTSTPLDGDVLVACIATNQWNSYSAVSSVTQTGVIWMGMGNPQAQSQNAHNSYYYDAEIWVGVVGPGASQTITINFSGSAAPIGAVADVCEYSGVSTSGFLDKTASSNGLSQALLTGTTATTTQADELWVGCTATDTGYYNQTSSGTSSPTNGFNLFDGRWNNDISMAYLDYFADSTGNASSGTTMALGVNWVGCIATLKAANATTVPVTINLEPDGGAAALSPSNAFRVSYYFGGDLMYAYLGSSALNINVDPSTTVTIGGSSSGSTASEEWVLNDGASATTFNSGTSGASETYVYYDLLSQSISCSVIGGGSPSVGLSYYTAPNSSSPVDQELSTALTPNDSGQTAWACRGATASAPATVAGAEGERWSDPGAASWLITSSDQIPSSQLYYHQFNYDLSYSVSGGSGYGAPNLMGIQYDASYTTTLNSSSMGCWLDSGSTWSVTNPLNGSGSEERWATSQAISGTVSATQAIAFTYDHQYYLTVYPPADGNLNVTSGWYNAGTVLVILATADPGYTLQHIQVDNTKPSANPYTITMYAPHTAAAYFSSPETLLSTIGSWLWGLLLVALLAIGWFGTHRIFQIAFVGVLYCALAIVVLPNVLFEVILFFAAFAVLYTVNKLFPGGSRSSKK